MARSTLPALVLRPAEASDHAVFARLFTELQTDEQVPSAAVFEREMMATTRIAENNGAGVGYVYFRPLVDFLHLSQLVTVPEVRRMGVARALMGAVVAEARLAECAFLSLNVLASNVSAIALYASLGFSFAYPSRGLDVPWSTADGADALVARPIEPSDDATFEREEHLPSGVLKAQRAQRGRFLRCVETKTGRALGVLVHEGPRLSVFRATDLAHARALLRALRPFAQGEDVPVRLVVENNAELADALIAAGAVQKLEMRHMQAIVAPTPSLR